ncbi:hypothetical protein [Streptosporangium sp. NPDC002607]
MALTLIGAFLLYIAVPNIGPVVRAARADGTPGVFTAERLYCVQHPGHESCSWIGRFRSDDGAVSRIGVTLHGSSRDSHHTGRETQAVDVGRMNRVYGPEGSSEWVFTVLMLVAGTAILAYPHARLLRRPIAGPPAPEPMA